LLYFQLMDRASGKNRNINPSGFPFSKLATAILLIAALIFISAGTDPKFKARYVKTKEGRRAAIEGSIFLRVPYPKKGGLNSVAEKYLGDKKKADLLLNYNPSPKKKKLSEVRILLKDLLPAYQIETISALFPEDKRVAEGWRHKVDNEGYVQLAKWFCGSTKKNDVLKNVLQKTSLKTGDIVVIPETILSEPFKSMKAEIEPKPLEKTPASPAPKEETQVKPALPELSTVEARKLLSYGKDDMGEYAAYNIAKGEALYSAVIVRFTGRLEAAEVNKLAMDVAARSGIADVTTIPAGYVVKIPLDLLLPQFYPSDSKTYTDWAAHQKDLDGIINTYKNAALDGVVVILDPGHGGIDRGAIKNKVWEDSYVYDIACRIREGLESKTKAKVFMTLMEPSKGFKPIDKPSLAPNKGATILTHPPFQPQSSDETKAGVNLRWVLANAHFNTLKSGGVDPQRIVFTSIHADSLHPSLRGTMFYIPGSSYRSNQWGYNGGMSGKIKECKGAEKFWLSDKDLEISEGLSKQFAKKIEESFKKNDLKLHPYTPTRDHVVRNRKAWVPAVLKYNIVPCNVLIEVCNINNAEDAQLLKDPLFRQKIANAYIEALILYYS
jgi:N-acetylmuramoyl-L-alanine amidase